MYYDVHSTQGQIFLAVPKRNNRKNSMGKTFMGVDAANIFFDTFVVIIFETEGRVTLILLRGGYKFGAKDMTHAHIHTHTQNIDIKHIHI